MIQIHIRICLLLQTLFYILYSKSLKLGNTTNDLLQVGDIILFEDYLANNQTIYYDHSLAYLADSSTANAALGLSAASFDTQQGQIGWQMYINEIQDTKISIQVTSPFIPNTIANIKIRYIVSSHALIEIQYENIIFDASDNVYDVYSQNQSACGHIYCRKTSTNLAYQPKNNQNSIKGAATLVGFHAIYSADPQNVSDTFGLDQPDYFGVYVGISSLGSTQIKIMTAIYSFANLYSVSLYHLTFQSSITNTQTTRTISGFEKIGCIYDSKSCDPLINGWVSSNTSFTTGQTYIETLYEDNFFYGLSYFIVSQPLLGACQNPLPISDFTFDPGQVPNATHICFPMSFEATLRSLSGNSYQLQMTFDGNNDQEFSLGFSYLIDVSFYCPSSGDIYYQSDQKHCDTVCNNGQKQYPNSTDFMCYNCDSLCYKCTGPTQYECTACYTSSHNRYLDNNQCLCKDGYYDSLTDDKCPQCHASCKTCSGAGSSLCLTCQTSDFRYDDGSSSCPCLPGYYHNGSDTCAQCHYTCETCQGGNQNNKCLTCDANNYRQIETLTSKCNCMQRYYHRNNWAQCQPCDYSCLTCSNSGVEDCLLCNNTAHRTSNSNNECICNDYFYSDGFNQLCLPCHISCLRCNGPTQTDCTKCDNTLHYGIITSTQKCLCIQKYFMFNFLCYQCHYSCLNCTDQNRNECTVCDQINNFRKLNLTTNECQCMDGYYDDYLNQIQICQPCDHRCLTCEHDSINCLTCDPLEYRVLTGNSCPCIYGYIQISGYCQICHYSCQTCSSNTFDTCLTCNTTIRYLDSGQCLCRTGTYDNQVQQDCKPCHDKCAECSGPTQSDCQQCDHTLYRTDPPMFPDFCPCIDNYFDISTDIYCQQCIDFCQTCQYNSTYCTSCDQTGMHRILQLATHQCVCKDNYFDDGSLICLQCADECLTCQVLADNCTTCDNLLQLVFGTILGVDKNHCQCIDGYYQDLVTGECLPCNSLCITCQNTSTQCLTCQTGLFRTKDGTDCICISGYYDNGVDYDCKPCPYYCPNCQDGPVCNTCSDINRDIFSNCECIPGYYNQGMNPICQLCSDTCQTCSTYGICLSCYESTQFRYLSVDQCICQEGYYNQLGNPICQLCHYSCETCNGGTDSDCQSCALLRIQDPFTSKCICEPNYYQAGDNMCYLCDSPCKQCDGLAANCTQCYNSMTPSNNQCICIDGTFFDSGSLDCQPCDVSCKRCEITAQNCLQCYVSTQMTFLSGTDCICYDHFYWNTNNSICQQCHETCKICFGPGQNQCNQCYQLTQFRHYDATSSMCLCSLGYYSSAGGICQQCIEGCTQCYGGSIYECYACQSDYTLIGTFCKEKIVCANYFYEGQCINVCPNTTYPVVGSQNYCAKCVYPCLNCISNTYCLSCVKLAFYNQTSHQCYQYCPQGYYIDGSDACVQCPQNCTLCAYSQQQEKPLCIKCISNYIIVDGYKCLSQCPQLTHVVTNNLCFKCLGNCETCSELDTKKCISCRQNTSLLQGQCHKVCPTGYYQSNKKCIQCNQTCQTCYEGECLSCSDGYYLSSKINQCIRLGYFINDKGQLEKCHLNCQTCTDRSFSSCILCSQSRGNPKNNMAESGYCNCQKNSIDIGMGKCDHQSFIAVVQANQILLSGTYATFFIAATTSIISGNFILAYSYTNYMQTYSAYYYLNASTNLMQIDKILQSYRLTNMMAWINDNQTTSNRRLLSQNSEQDSRIQSNQSLFLRGYQGIYLIDLCYIIVWLIVIIWVIDFLIYFCLRCFAPLKQYQDNDSKGDNQIPKQFQISQIDTSEENTFTKKIVSFYQVYHEGVAIAVHLCVSTQVTILAIISIKILLTNQYQVDYFKLILSAIITLFIIGYTFRLLILTLILKKSSQYKSIRLLYTMHIKQKLKNKTSRIYIPVTMLKNQVVMTLIVALSDDFTAQIVSSGCIYLIFTLYSIFYCPFPNSMRIFVHIQEVVFLLQIVMLLVAVNSVFGDYTAAIILLVLNYVQIMCFLVFAIVLLVKLLKNYLIQSNQIANQNDQIKKDSRNKESKQNQNYSFAKIKPEQKLSSVLQQTQIANRYETQQGLDNTQINDFPQIIKDRQSPCKELENQNTNNVRPKNSQESEQKNIIRKVYRLVRSKKKDQKQKIKNEYYL